MSKKNGTQTKSTASAVRRELEIIQKRHRGILRPGDVVEFAEDPKTALHSRFEWDDGEAAHQYRLEQARHLIRYVVTVVDPKRPPIRAYYSLRSDRETGDSYRDTVSIMRDEDYKAELLQQALREALSWQERYKHLAELAPIIAAIKKVTTRHRKGGGYKRSGPK